MSLLKKALLAACLATLAVPVVGASTLDLDDRTENPVYILDGNPLSTTPFPDGADGIGIFQIVPGIYPSVNVRFVILDPGTTDVSDLFSLQVVAGDVFNTTFIFIQFASDLEGPLTYVPDPTLDELITETGDFQTVYSASDLGPNGNADLVIRFASDVDTTPEPASLALLGLGLTLLTWSRRRSAQRR